MTFKLSCELDYTAQSPLSFLLNIRVQENSCQQVVSEQFSLVPQMPHVQHRDPVTGNRFDQIDAQMPGIYHIRYEATVENSPALLTREDLAETPVQDFNLDVLSYLYASRYCQSDRLINLAAQQFAGCATPLERVQAVLEWIREHISYVSGSTNSSTSAVDTLVERRGVCRDFAHLGIAMCRAMNIPARYFTGYAHDLNPPDFHACLETWIGGRWLLWDATGLASPDAIVRIGTGRDAAEVSVCTSFGSLKLERQNVACQSANEGYSKLDPERLKQMLVSHG